jgi:hypothetical protein
MRHFFTILLLASSSLCFGQFTRDKEPVFPSIDTVAAAQSYYTSIAATRTDAGVYLCDSKIAKAYHSSQNCRGLVKCTHGVVKLTKKEAEEEYGQVKCQVCY